MKTIQLIVVTLLLAQTVTAQDKSCIKSKWIAVKNDATNSHLFDADHNRIDSMEVFQEIKYLIENETLKLDDNEAGFGLTANALVDGDSLHANTEFLEFRIQKQSPLLDEDGNAIIHTSEDGTMSFVYPTPKVIPVALGNVYELRIKEENINGTFTPTTVVFCIKNENSSEEVVWVDLASTQRVAQNSELKHWTQEILDKHYSGFQFKQTQCSDEFER